MFALETISELLLKNKAFLWETRILKNDFDVTSHQKSNTFLQLLKIFAIKLFDIYLTVFCGLFCKLLKLLWDFPLSFFHHKNAIFEISLLFNMTVNL